MIELGVSYMSDIAHKCLELEHQVERWKTRRIVAQTSNVKQKSNKIEIDY